MKQAKHNQTTSLENYEHEMIKQAQAQDKNAQ